MTQWCEIPIEKSRLLAEPVAPNAFRFHSAEGWQGVELPWFLWTLTSLCPVGSAPLADPARPHTEKESQRPQRNLPRPAAMAMVTLEQGRPAKNNRKRQMPNNKNMFPLTPDNCAQCLEDESQCGDVVNSDIVIDQIAQRITAPLSEQDKLNKDVVPTETFIEELSSKLGERGMDETSRTVLDERKKVIGEGKGPSKDETKKAIKKAMSDDQNSKAP